MTDRSTPLATVGLTRDAGFEIGVSRTIDLPIARVRAYLTSEQGVRRWLGEGLKLPASPGDLYATADGTTGEVRSFHPENRIRLTWQPAGWDHPTTLQVAVGDRSGRTLLRFHQERLADSAERSAQRAHWEGVMGDVLDDLRAAIGT